MHTYIHTYIYICIDAHTYTYINMCNWAAILHLSMFDLIIKTHFVYIISLGSFQVS